MTELVALDVPPRIGRLRERLAREEIDALLVTKLANVRYLTGFTGSAAMLLVAQDHALFVTDGRYLEQSKEQLAAAGVDTEVRIEIGLTAAAQSAALAAAIRESQAGAGSAGTGAPSAAGLIWPIDGVVTSGFGMRWGRMHEGLDIAAPIGTPIWAAAAATVIHAGWLSGYGNLVVVDHGNGVATAYGHNSSVTVGVGPFVAQGQLVAYSGNTGHSTGPHVPFAVRINGTAVDPLGYL